MINYPNREENGGLLEVQILQFLSTAIFRLASVFTILIRIISKRRQDEPLGTDALKHFTVHRMAFVRVYWGHTIPSTVPQFSS